MKSRSYRLALLVATVGTSSCNFQAVEARTQEMKEEIESVHRTTDSLGRDQQSLILETSRIQNTTVRPESLAEQLKALEEKLAATTAELDEAIKHLGDRKTFLSKYTAQFGKR